MIYSTKIMIKLSKFVSQLLSLINDRWSHRQKRQVNKAGRRLYTFRTSVLLRYFWKGHKNISHNFPVPAAIFRDLQTPCCAQNFQRTNHQFIFVILLIVDILSPSSCDCIARFIKKYYSTISIKVFIYSISDSKFIYIK